MKPNDIVTVHQMYKTDETEVEGRARLIKKLIPDRGYGREFWSVIFLNDPYKEICYRWIKNQKEK